MTKSWKSIAIAAALLAPLFVFFNTAQSIVAIWNSSETFAHGYIIAPISLWMIWRRRETISKLSVTPFWPALIALALSGFSWLLADLANVQVVRQYSLVAMFPLLVLFVFGLRISSAIAFPLLFLMLAVPFGEIFINPLINFTADFTIFALQMTGIPVLREGTHFTIPSGSWSVVEACSGVRYLISSFTLGCLYAYLTYRSFLRRTLFILFSILVPIIANGLRAYMIVMIGHLSSMKLAVGFDHLIYGWLFFGLVMFLMFWVGSFWREPVEPSVSESTPFTRQAPANSVTSSQLMIAAASAIFCVSIWPLYANYLDRLAANPDSANLDSFQSNWKEIAPLSSWTPDFMPANAQFNQSYQRDAQQVGLAIRYYRNQAPASMLISSSNQLAKEKNSVWRQSSISGHQEMIGSQPVRLIESTLLDGSGRKLLVWHWYWVAGEFTANTYEAKLLQAKEKLFTRGDDGAAIFLYAPYAEKPEQTRQALAQFLQDNMQSLSMILVKNKKH